jgi:hypothetical protein
MTIKVVLFKGSTFAACVVRYVTRSKYAHAAIVVGGTYYEARPFYGVRKIENWEEKLKDEEYEVFHLKTTEPYARCVTCFLKRQLGKGYDWFGLLGFVGGATRADRKSRGKWFCSELVAVVCERLEQPLLRADPWLLSPRDLSLSTVLKVGTPART